jgi:Domain of unknown function (DUF4314)
LSREAGVRRSRKERPPPDKLTVTIQGGEPMINLRPGDRIELIHCSDPHTRLRQGDRGTVTLIDDAGTVHVYWDEGSRCRVVPGEDEWKVLPDPTVRPDDVEIDRRGSPE